jgi:hypothetical protein
MKRGLSPSVVIVIFLQFKNADPAMKSTFRGMKMNFNKQFWKHKSSIQVSLDSASNMIDSKAHTLQKSPAKHDFARISTFRGMMIAFKEQEENHKSSIRVSRDSASNVIDLS